MKKSLTKKKEEEHIVFDESHISYKKYDRCKGYRKLKLFQKEIDEQNAYKHTTLVPDVEREKKAIH